MSRCRWRCRLAAATLFISVPNLWTQEVVCRTGLGYTPLSADSMSYERGYVVNFIAPYSPAEQSGIRLGDIIEAVQGYSTEMLSQEQMSQLMHSTERQYLLALRRGDNQYRVVLTPECKSSYELTERELALLFSGYSPEDTFAGQIRYLYTGIVYNRDALSRIRDVEPKSPALAAGLLPGDIIKKVNGVDLKQETLDELWASYDAFMRRMQVYRPQNGVAEEEGFAPWFTDAYRDVLEQIRRDKSDAVMSYLFAFRPYISFEPSRVLIFEVERAGTRYEVELGAELRKEASLLSPQNIR